MNIFSKESVMSHLQTDWLTLPVLLFSLLLSATTQSATITVNTTADIIWLDGECSLREAIYAAANNSDYYDCTGGDDNNDTIVFDASVSGTIVTSGLSIGNDLTIAGPGAANLTLSGNSSNRVLLVTGASPVVALSGLTIMAGNTATTGGGIYKTGNASLTLENVNVEYNSASRGGGIYNGFGSLTIRNSNISNNTSTGTGGGIDNTGTLIIESSRVDDNTASTLGGGIYNDINAVVTLTDSGIYRNMANLSGGGLYNTTGGIVTLNNSHVTGNTATSGNGGGIVNSGYLTLLASPISGNTSFLRGSAIANSLNGLMWMNASTVWANDVTGVNNQSAIYQNGLARITNSTISANTSAGLENTSNANTILSNVTITLNTTNGYIHAGTMQLKNTIISNNTAADCSNTGTGYYTDAGYNLDSDGSCNLTGTGSQSSVDPLLGALADNGGNTLTHALQSGSPAIDAGNPAGCLWDHDNDDGTDEVVLTQDQRGTTRPLDGDADGSQLCDIGAYEVLIPGEIEVTDSVSPNDDLAVSFAGTEENTSSGSETVTLANLGSEVLTVSGLQLTGADANEFSFDVSAGSNPCGGLAIVINGSSSCTVGVTFSPTTIGTKSANLEITSDDADEATINVALNGTGITAGGGNTASDGGGGGCTVSKSGQSRLDPLFPLMLLACAWYLTNIRRGTRKD